MKISNMAWSNFKGNMYRYVMYFLSNSFAVMSFFIFLNFLYHPAIDLNNLGGHYAAAHGAAMAVKACLFIIMGFSVVFAYYANSVFIKSRGQEIGLLSLYGMTKKQIRKYLFIENTIIAVLSTLTGIVLGGVFSKLFLMAMERFIDVELAFVISGKVVLISLLAFLAIFEIINYISLYKINDRQIVEQVKSDKLPKKVPNFSRGKALLGVGLLILGYGVAWIVEGAAVILAMIPVTAIVIAGSYFTITQFSIYFIDKLNNNERIKNKGTNIISLSQLRFKLQDTAKILFIAAILGAVTFTATETIFTFYKDVDEITGVSAPQDILIMDFEDNARSKKAFDTIKEKLVLDEVAVEKEVKTQAVLAKGLIEDEREINTTESALVMPLSEYNRMVEVYDEAEKLELKNKDEAIYINPSVPYDRSIKEDFSYIPSGSKKIEAGKNTYDFKIKEEILGAALPSNRLAGADLYILTDSSYEKIAAENKKLVRDIYSFNVDSKKKAYDQVKEFWHGSPEASDENLKFLTSIISHVETRRSFGLILFIGFFISFLFFIATGSIIYFKLFNELKQDREEYTILKKIGIKDRELNRIINRQIGLIFFIPFIISTVHSFFALKSLANFVELNLLLNGLMVMGIYLVFQIIYFVFIKKAYKNKLEIF